VVFFEAIVDGGLGPVAEQFRMLYDVNPRIAIPFNFGGMWLPWGAKAYGDYIREFQGMIRPTDIEGYCFSNHDQPRIASRFGRKQARLVAMLALTLPGIPTVYYIICLSHYHSYY
jgi:alpha-glucosidase